MCNYMDLNNLKRNMSLGKIDFPSFPVALYLQGNVMNFSKSVLEGQLVSL